MMINTERPTKEAKIEYLTNRYSKESIVNIQFKPPTNMSAW